MNNLKADSEWSQGEGKILERRSWKLEDGHCLPKKSKLVMV
jgi:hypothetical protein